MISLGENGVIRLEGAHLFRVPHCSQQAGHAPKTPGKEIMLALSSQSDTCFLV